MIYLIARSVVFDPDSALRAEKVYRALTKEFQAQGEEIVCLSEDELIDNPNIIHESESGVSSCIVSMGRDLRTIRILEGYESMGYPVLNSPSGVLYNTRSELDNLLSEAGIGLNSMVDSKDAEAIEAEVGYPLWIKPSDNAKRSDDVHYIENRQQLQAVLADFSKVGYEHWTISEHIVGDLIIFYGVEGTDFFNWSYPRKNKSYAYDQKTDQNGKPQGYKFSAQKLKDALDEVADNAGIPIYGGEAIVRRDGKIVVVDFNDFPSFTACGKEAASAIADRALQEM